MTPSVRVYTDTRCAFCDRAKALLAARGVPFTEVSLAQDHEARMGLTALTGKMTVPQVFIGERFIGGFDALARMDRDGSLAALRP